MDQHSHCGFRTAKQLKDASKIRKESQEHSTQEIHEENSNISGNATKAASRTSKPALRPIQDTYKKRKKLIVKGKKLIAGQKTLAQFFSTKNNAATTCTSAHTRVNIETQTKTTNSAVQSKKPASIFQCCSKSNSSSAGVSDISAIDKYSIQDQKYFPKEFSPKICNLPADAFTGPNPTAIIVPAWLVGRNFYRESIVFDSVGTCFQEVKLKREPENNYDPNAIMVFNSKDEQVGHVEGCVAAVLSFALDNNLVSGAYGFVAEPPALNDSRYPMYLVCKGLRNNSMYNPSKNVKESETARNFTGFSTAKMLSNRIASSERTHSLENLLKLSNERCNNNHFKTVIKKREMLQKKREKGLAEKRKRLKWQQKTLTGPILTNRKANRENSTNFDGWDSLGTDLLRRIFSSGTLSFRDLCLRARLVSKTWCAVIDDESFLEYQRLYYIPSHLRLSTFSKLCSFAEMISLARERFGHWLSIGIVSKLLSSESQNHHLLEDGKNHMDCGITLLLKTLLFSGVKRRRSLIRLILPKRTDTHVLASSDIPRHELSEVLFFTLFAIKCQMLRKPSNYHLWAAIRNEIEQCVLLSQTCPTQTLESVGNSNSQWGILNEARRDFENSRSEKIKRTGKRHLTGEQLQAVRMTLNPGEVLKIKALAGTGKTTTLREYALARPNQKMLYLAFNVSVREEAAKGFPSNVDCKNVNQLAYAKMGIHRYQKANKFAPTVDPRKLHKILQDAELKSKICGQGSMSTAFTLDRCDLMIECLNRFLRSKDFDISYEKHVAIPFSLYVSQKLATNHTLSDFRQVLLTSIKGLWSCMKDLRETRIPLTHDGYLKLYQLSRPDLSISYDVIMLDEAQDANPCTRDIVTRQTCAKILVGDQYQAIYGFLGAEDALSDKNVPSTYSITLTRSFRFGPNIAAVANLILTELGSKTSSKYERTLLLGGKMTNGSNHDRDIDDVVHIPRNSYTKASGRMIQHRIYEELYVELLSVLRKKIGNDEGDGSTCLVARTNTYLWMCLFNLLENGPKYFKVGFVSNKSGIEKIEDTAYLMLGAQDKITTKFLKTMKSIDQLVHFVKHVKSSDWGWILQMVTRVRPERILDMCSKIRKQTVPFKRSHIIFSTVHAAKGLEFDHVLLGEDFPLLCMPPQGITREDVEETEEGCTFRRRFSEFRLDMDSASSSSGIKEEVHALYVALTRAKRTVRLNASLTDLLSITGLSTFFMGNPVQEKQIY